MGNLTQRQIEVAVGWWCSLLNGAQAFSALRPEERNDRENESTALAEIKATVASGDGIDALRLTLFREKLSAILASNEFRPEHDLLHVDYSPEWFLAQALEAAGIPVGTTTLPWKTSMMFRDGGVVASRGEGSPVETLL